MTGGAGVSKRHAINCWHGRACTRFTCWLWPRPRFAGISFRHSPADVGSIIQMGERSMRNPLVARPALRTRRGFHASWLVVACVVRAARAARAKARAGVAKTFPAPSGAAARHLAAGALHKALARAGLAVLDAGAASAAPLLRSSLRRGASTRPCRPRPLQRHRQRPRQGRTQRMRS